MSYAREKRARVCFPFIGDSVGGSHMSALLLIQGLAHSRYETSIVIHQEGPLAEHLRAVNLPFELVPLPVYAGGTPNAAAIALAMLRNLPRLARYLKQHRVDIVHANDLRTNLTWSAPTRLTGRPFVWHQRTLPYSSSFLWRSIGLLSSHVVYNSEIVARTMPATSRTPTSVISNPVALPQPALSRKAAKSAIAREFGFDLSTTIVGFVGRLVRLKRPDVFVTAGARLAKRVPNISFAFVVIGNDEAQMIPELQHLAASMEIEDRVHFAGFRHPVEEWISGMDLLMATSEREPFGRTLIESMALGTPVVASRAAGHVEIVEHEYTGLLVSPNDADAFAAAAHRVLTDAALAAELAENGRACAADQYSVGRHTCRISSIYDSLL